MIRVGKPAFAKDSYMSPESLSSIGKLMSDSEMQLIKGVAITQLKEEGNAEQTISVLAGMAGGVQTKQEIPVTQYTCETKQGKTVKVSSPEAMKVILESGGQLVSEEIKVITI